MARLWSSGFELNSTTAAVEYESNFQTTPSISITSVRSGTYSLNASTSGNRKGITQGYSANAEGSYFFRVYMRIVDAVNAQEPVIRVRDTSGNVKVSIRSNTDNTLELWNEEDGAQVGGDSSALSVDTWYRIELSVDSTTLASTAIEAKIDGTTFASGTIDITESPGQLQVGSGLNANDTSNLFFDDVAINNSSGSFQNSWPGAGKIIHLRPNAAGDNSDWSTGTGTSFAEVDEVTPDDVTTYISSVTATEVSDFNIDAPAGLSNADTINVVAVGVRVAASPAGSSQFVLRIKATSGGTVEESGAIQPAGTYVTNATSVPRNYALTLYDLPGASTTAWTKAELDTAQIGVRLSTSATSHVRVSTLWALIDYTPAGTYFGSASTNSATTGTAVSVSAPSDVVDGDIVIVHVHANGNTTIVDNNGATPFTEDINDYQPNAASGHTVSVFSRRIQSGDPTTYNFTIGASGRWSVIAASFHNPHASDIYDVAPSTTNAAAVNDTASADITAPTITTTTTNALHVVGACWDTANFSSSTQPSGYLKIAEINNQPQSMAFKVIDTASATGAQLYTSSELNPRAAWSYAIKDVNADGGGGGDTFTDWPKFERNGFWSPGF